MCTYAYTEKNWIGNPAQLQKQICRTVGPSLAASLKPLAHRLTAYWQNVLFLISLFVKLFL